jgi:elongation factor Ts
VASLSPRWVSREDIPKSEVERELAIYREQALAEGKAEDRMEQIVTGRLRKFYEAFCLLDQAWLRDEGSKPRRVDEVIKATVAATGENISVARFIRYQLGEQLDSGEPDGA